ncbi:hypothetical protein [Dickeya zeae]|uniref:hypothetical protein n=1 Tax=Dickeya zeae TaxID=204042 RepID=UPI003DA09F6B
MLNPTQSNIKDLFDGLNSYLANGYVNELSSEDPEKEAFDYLNKLYLINEREGLAFCKLILESEILYNDFLRAACLSYLLLSECDWQYAFSFIIRYSESLSVPSLKDTLFYFFCAKNESDPHPIPDGLFKKLMERYQMIKNEPDADFYHLHEVYSDFVKAYSLDT